MSNLKYKLFRTANIKLAESIIIKSEHSAANINKTLASYGVHIGSNPREWKYYLNLTGEYHSVDEHMIIKSIDYIDQEIIFNKQNLLLHRATFLEYKKDGSLYRAALILKYPKQRRLINSILNPIDMDTLLAAPDYSIVRHDKNLIKDNETSLLINIADWLKQFTHRYMITDYLEADTHYLVSYLHLRNVTLPGVIMNLRLDKCGTSEAHDFHISAYLESHARLGKFVPYLNLKQKIYLYKNIKYLQENIGKQSSLDILAEVLLHSRGMPLFKYDVRHNLENIANDIVPVVDVVKRVVKSEIETGVVSIISVRDMYEKQSNIAPANIEDIDIDSSKAKDSIGVANTDRIGTKVLETEIIDYSSSLPITLPETLVNQWLYYAANDIYAAKFQIYNKYTNETYKINAKEAFIMWVYCICKSRNQDPVNIPIFTASNVLRLQLPTVLNVCALGTYPWTSLEDGVEALDDIPFNNRLTHPQFLYEKAVSIFKRRLVHREQWLCAGNVLRQGMLENMTSSLYQTVTCTLTDIETYETFFTYKNIDMSNMVKEDFAIIADKISSVCTGVDINPYGSLFRTQSAMLEIIDRLTSYNIHFVKTLMGYPAKYLNLGQVGISNNSILYKTDLPIDISNSVEHMSTSKVTDHDEVININIDISVSKRVVQTADIDIPIHCSEQDYKHYSTSIHLGEFNITESVNYV